MNIKNDGQRENEQSGYTQVLKVRVREARDGLERKRGGRLDRNASLRVGVEDVAIGAGPGFRRRVDDQSLVHDKTGARWKKDVPDLANGSSRARDGRDTFKESAVLTSAVLEGVGDGVRAAGKVAARTGTTGGNGGKLAGEGGLVAGEGLAGRGGRAFLEAERPVRQSPEKDAPEGKDVRIEGRPSSRRRRSWRVRRTQPRRCSSRTSSIG